MDDTPGPAQGLDPTDAEQLEEAVAALERPGFAMRVVNLIGMPIEAATKMLPGKAGTLVAKATHLAVSKALGAAVSTMRPRGSGAPSRWLHRAAVAGSGAAGGFFGLAGVAAELPVSTVLMLRAIADIARSQGEDIGSAESQLACVQVFALGGRQVADDASETAYYAVRVALARTLAEAAEYVATRGLTGEGAPILVRFIARVAARFNVVVTEKVAAQAVPVLGAASGAAINLMFMSSFQRTAWGHFVVRRLERRYGPRVVRAAYEAAARRQGLITS